MQKQIHLAPQTAEEDAYNSSSAVSSREFKILRKRVSEDKAELLAQINVTADEIALKASKTYVDGQVSSLQSQITVNAGNIALKVSSTDYNGNTIASLINQTATTIAISASKINLTGYITATNLATAGQTTINGGNITTGTMSADRIYGGTINGSVVNVTNLNASNITAGSLSVGRLQVGTSLGNAGKIYFGADYISLYGNSTSDATVNFVSSSGTARIYAKSNSGQPTINMDRALYIDGGLYTSGGLVPRADNTYNIGFSSARWVDVWAVDGTINTSDMSDKKDIKKLENSSVAFIKALKPIKFKWKKGKREHLGFLAQEVKQAMDATIGDAGIFVDPSVGGEEGHQGLRYAEFISPIIDTLQNVLERLEAIENEKHN